MDTSFIETNQPCPDCGSSDALAINEDGSTKCFSCESFNPKGGGQEKLNPTMKKQNNFEYLKGEASPLPARGIHLDTCKKYNYKVGKNEKGQWVHIANYIDDDGKIIGQKIRTEGKNFQIRGKISHRFYGQHLWKNGGNKLIVVEGEIDCLTMSQLQANKYPCVSISQGVASAKTLFKKNIPWLESFKEVILMFDEDEHGRKAVKECVSILKPGKTFVARLSGKDPNDLLMQGKGEEVVKAMWDAKKWSPANIINGADLFERISTIKSNDSIPYPFPGLNSKTKGLRKGEISLFCAGSGVGKSQVCRQIAHHLLTTTDKKVGYIALEENIERSGQGILGLELGRLLHLDPVEIDEKYHEAYDKTVGSGRFFVYDHWGSMNTEQLLNHIRYMVQAMGVEYVVLDHISIVVSGMKESEMGNERKAIDVLMTQLRALVEESNFALILISHLKRPEGNKGFEDGLMPNLSALRGSQSLSQLSDIVCALSRNLQGEEKNITKLSVLKNRFSGETGLACSLEFCPFTGKLTEVEVKGEF